MFTPRISGSGDYSVKVNSVALGRDTVPVFGNGKNSTIVRHREYVQSIITSEVAGQFKIETFTIDPRDSATFPWLSKIAENYSEYRIHGLVAYYLSKSGDALTSTNTALGKICVSTQYNVYDGQFPNIQFMENTEYANACKPSCDIIHPLECSKFQSPEVILFMNDDSSEVPGDRRLSQFANLSVATQGCQGTGVEVGELWLSYDIEFLKPRQNDSIDIYAHFQNQTPANSPNVTYPLAVLSGGGSFNPTFTATSSSFFPGLVLFNDDDDALNIKFPDWFFGSVIVIVSVVLMDTLIGTHNNQSQYGWQVNSGNVSGLQLLEGNTVAQSEYNYIPEQGYTYLSHNACFFTVSGGGIVGIGTTSPLPIVNTCICQSADVFIFSIGSLTN